MCTDIRLAKSSFDNLFCLSLPFQRRKAHFEAERMGHGHSGTLGTLGKLGKKKWRGMFADNKSIGEPEGDFEQE